jgi:hypothetical protein
MLSEMSRFALASLLCLLCAAGALTVACISGQAQSVPSENIGSDVEIRFDRTGVTLPCICEGKVMHPSSTESGIVRVSSFVKRETNEALNYRYIASGGRIVGDGANVVWDFTDGFAPGEYSITVVIDNVTGTYSGTASATRTVAEPCCLCPCTCPALSIESSPKEVKRGGRLDFEGRVIGAPPQNIQYKWSVVNGLITSGQGTPVIHVIATSKNGFASVNANLEISLEKDCGCLTFVSDSVPIVTRTSKRKFTAGGVSLVRPWGRAGQ